MSRLITACASLAVLAFASGAAAQSDHMMNDNMHMSKTQMNTMHRCQSMSHDMMMKNHKCMMMMKMHPDMMKDSMGDKMKDSMSDKMGH